MYSFNEESCAFEVRVSFFSSFLLAWCRFVCQLVAFHRECSMAGLEQAPKIQSIFVQFYCVFWLVSLKKLCTFDAEFFLHFLVNGSSVVVLRRHRHLFCSSHVFLRYAFTNIYPGSMLYVLVLLLAFQLLMLIPILHALHCNTMLFMAFDTWISERTIYLPNSNNTNSLSIMQCCCCYHVSMISKSQILSKSQTSRVF